jgi:porin
VITLQLSHPSLRACVRVAVLAASLGGAATTAAFAQVAASPQPAASPSAASPGSNNGRAVPQNRNPQTPNEPGVPNIAGLLGDFGNGDRANLARHGFTLDGHLVSESAANLSGGLPLGGTAYARGTALSSEFAFGFDLDFDKLNAHSGAGILHFLLTTRFGSNLSSQAIGNNVSVEEIYGDGQTTRITFADYEQPLFDKRLDLRFGKYNQQNDFIAGSTYWGGNLYCFYQNNNICGTPAGIPNNNGVVSTGSAGYVYYPSSEWGARLKLNLRKDLYIQAAAIQANPLVNNPDGGLYLGFNGGIGTELPFEIGLTFNDRAGKPTGNLRLGGYYDTANVEDFAARAGGTIALRPNETDPAGSASNAAAIASLGTGYARGSSGAYVQADHLVEGRGGAGQRGTAVFASFEYSDPQTSLLSTMAEIGVVRHGTFRGRPLDTLAAGFATDDYNVRLQALEASLQAAGYAVPSTRQEQVAELTYGFQATSWFVLRPGVQFVINPGGVTANASAGVLNPPRDALVIGLGGYITL